MNTTMLRGAILAALTAAASAPVFAQTAPAPVAAPTTQQQRVNQVLQRDVNQEQRIEKGLQSGQLNTREAGRLEREEARVDHAEANALRDGRMSAQEQARINQMQNNVSRDIAREKHDGQVGNPNSASSQRMQAAVQRDINQQQRIQQGVQSGSLNNREVSHLERGQAHDDRIQARAAADGHVGAHESARIQHSENVQSRRIHREKHDAK